MWSFNLLINIHKGRPHARGDPDTFSSLGQNRISSTARIPKLVCILSNHSTNDCANHVGELPLEPELCKHVLYLPTSRGCSLNRGTLAFWGLLQLKTITEQWLRLCFSPFFCQSQCPRFDPRYYTTTISAISLQPIVRCIHHYFLKKSYRKNCSYYSQNTTHKDHAAVAYCVISPLVIILTLEHWVET